MRFAGRGGRGEYSSEQPDHDALQFSRSTVVPDRSLVESQIRLGEFIFLFKYFALLSASCLIHCFLLDFPDGSGKENAGIVQEVLRNPSCCATVWSPESCVKRRLKREFRVTNGV